MQLIANFVIFHIATTIGISTAGLQVQGLFPPPSERRRCHSSRHTVTGWMRFQVFKLVKVSVGIKVFETSERRVVVRHKIGSLGSVGGNLSATR
jgi:hypothetical protein